MSEKVSRKDIKTNEVMCNIRSATHLPSLNQSLFRKETILKRRPNEYANTLKMVRAMILSAFVSFLAMGSTHGFSPSQQRDLASSTSLNGFGDAFKSAFANDDSLGKRKNEGLAGGPKYNENVSMNGKAVPGVVVGQKLTVVGGKARVKIPVNCQQGDCGAYMSRVSF